MRFCIDWEFADDGSMIEPISVGVVGEDGREFYAVNGDVNVQRALGSKFLREQVWPHLPVVYLPKGSRPQRKNITLDYTHPTVLPLRELRSELRAFLLEPGVDVELWAWFAAYDHVTFAQLWGPMTGLTGTGMPMFTRDIRGYAARLGDPELPEQPTNVHHALFDAHHDWVRLRALEALERQRVEDLLHYRLSGVPEDVVDVQALADDVLRAVNAATPGAEVAW
jgi:hypothetical protein